jgi:hypothetical protein
MADREASVTSAVRLAEAVMRMHIVGAIEFLTEVIDDE